ncbi:hypothetical protein QF042_003743 [Pedobacter sp. W3I1]|uniref:MauE/DoxX family redox-associated membrane protein n=1 Tax=Pedobacter sp. W3I1 TaxID=3042291 RepID=UPI002786AC43|nr:hypothetical protein [Pedobacter sp. W3I1]
MKERFLIFAVSALIILWVYTAGSKVLEFHEFRHQLKLQHFNNALISLLSVILPLSEAITAFLLSRPASRMPGLYSSLFLLTVFTIYIILILLGFFEKTPCSCGGVLKEMSWKTHLLFNVSLLSLNLWAVYYIKQKERRSEK